MGAIAGAVVAAVGVAVSAGMGADAANKANKASKAAREAQEADARERALQDMNAQSEEMAGMVGSMMNPADANGDPAINQYLQQMGYMAPGGPQGEAVAGEPSEPPDPSTPRQQIKGGGSPSGMPV